MELEPPGDKSNKQCRAKKQHEPYLDRSNAARLYGRDDEIQVLSRVYQHCTNANAKGLVLIRGASGTGKTSLANALQPAVQESNGFFLSGKFELTRNQNPFAAYVTAFTQWTELILGNNVAERQQDERFSLIRDAIVMAMGKEGNLLTNMIPSLEAIVGVQEESFEVTAAEAVQRLQYAFCSFCHAISSIAPLVLVLDDLQWSDKASLDLLDALLSQPTSASTILVIGTYRDDEVKPSSQTLDSPSSDFETYLHDKKLIEAPPDSLQTSLIHLEGLRISSLNKMIAETLEVPPIQTANLAQWLHSKCKGNAFYALEWLRLLQERNIVQKGEGGQEFVFREHDTKGLSLGDGKIADDVVLSQIMQLSEFTQNVLRMSACIGDDIDEYALAILLDCKAAEISASLADAEKFDLVTYSKVFGRYRFRHDRIRQATLSTVEDVDALSFDCGYKLWKNACLHYRYTKIFSIASLMLTKANIMSTQSDRLELAEFYQEAGVKASSLAAFADSSRYTETGILLVEGLDCWEQHYDLTLKLFNLAVDAELCIQNFDRVKVLVSEILAHGRSCMDKVTAYTAMINAAGQSGSFQEALDIGIDVLRKLGVVLPPNPGMFCIIKDIIRTRMAVGSRSDYDILSLPRMQDETMLAAMHVLHNLIPYTFQLGSPCFILIGTKLVQLTMKHGISKLSSQGFVTYAWVLCQSNSKEGFRFGQLSMSIVQQFRARELIAKVHTCSYMFTSHWTRPLMESISPLKEVSLIGISMGDVEFAIHAASFRANLCLFSGMQLSLVEDSYTEVIAQMIRYNQKNALLVALPVLQYIHNLTGRAPDPKVLSGLAFTQKDRIVENKVQLVTCSALGADLAFLFGDYELAQGLSVTLQNSKTKHFAIFPFAVGCFNDGLIAASHARRRDKHYRQHINIIRKSLHQISKLARECPQNFLQKEKLLQAELKSLTRNKGVSTDVLALYEEAIRESSRQGFRQDAARASELAGDYLHRHQDQQKAEELWSQACNHYLEWGATAKAALLRHRMDHYPEGI